MASQSRRALRRIAGLLTSLLCLGYLCVVAVAGLELDSWWYLRNMSGGGGTIEWLPRPDVFPGGEDFMAGLQRPLWLHSRYFDPWSVYAKNYTFIDEVSTGTWEMALPYDRRLYFDLMTVAKRWGLRVFEQDWCPFPPPVSFVVPSPIELPFSSLWFASLRRLCGCLTPLCSHDVA